MKFRKNGINNYIIFYIKNKNYFKFILIKNSSSIILYSKNNTIRILKNIYYNN